MTKYMNDSRILAPDAPQERQAALDSIGRKLQDDQIIRAVKFPDRDEALHFRDAALPHLNDVYTLARYLLRDPTEAEDAAQECYLRAYRHFSTFRGGPIKPWLMAILRNVCRDQYSRYQISEVTSGNTFRDGNDCAQPLWQEPQPTPETEMLRGWIGRPSMD